MNKHEKLVAAAKEAVDAVHADTSVTQQQTVDSLEEIVEHAELLRVTVADEIEQAAREAGAVVDDGEGSET